MLRLNHLQCMPIPPSSARQLVEVPYLGMPNGNEPGRARKFSAEFLRTNGVRSSYRNLYICPAKEEECRKISSPPPTGTVPPRDIIMYRYMGTVQFCKRSTLLLRSFVEIQN
jgi:hypothetical protein